MLECGLSLASVREGAGSWEFFGIFSVILLNWEINNVILQASDCLQKPGSARSASGWWLVGRRFHI